MYVVTGATGNTGRSIAKHLLARGEKVRVVGRSQDRLQPLAAQGAEPLAADLTDAAALSQAFTGAQAVYVMLPPEMQSQDYFAHQDRVSTALALALENAKVKYAVSLSSIGADKPDKTGPVRGLYVMEQKLNRIAGLNVLHLRAGYFMENTLAQAGIIQMLGKTAGPLRGDLKVPMIATRDIGAAAAQALLKLDFRGHVTRELLGQRDITMQEVTTILGKTLDKTGLEYLQLPDEQVRPALLQLGLSGNVAGLLLELAAALNSGHVKALEPRTAQNTTLTSYETFAAEEFVPAYEGKAPAA